MHGHNGLLVGTVSAILHTIKIESFLLLFLSSVLGGTSVGLVYLAALFMRIKPETTVPGEVM